MREGGDGEEGLNSLLLSSNYATSILLLYIILLLIKITVIANTFRVLFMCQALFLKYIYIYLTQSFKHPYNVETIMVLIYR